MLEACIVLCFVAAAMAGDDVDRPGGRKSLPCPDPQKCPWRRCPKGMFGPRCGRRRFPPCELGYTCIRGRCCRDPPPCPAGSLTGPTCNPWPCELGYTCWLGRCCSNQCPNRHIQGPLCDTSSPCKPGYRCLRNVCCKRVPFEWATECPPGEILETLGDCLMLVGCYIKGSYCYKDSICCLRQTTSPPPAQ